MVLSFLASSGGPRGSVWGEGTHTHSSLMKMSSTEVCLLFTSRPVVSKETQDVRTEAGVDRGVRGRGRGVIGDLLPFSLVCRYSGAVDTDRPPSFAIKLEHLGQREERGGTCKQSRKEVCAWVKGTWVMTAGMGKGRGMKMRAWAPGWAGSQWRLAGNGGGEQRGR